MNRAASEASATFTDGVIAILDKWNVTSDERTAVLDGNGRLTRVTFIVAINKALHIALHDDLADAWMTSSNDDPLFGGQTPLGYALREGIPGFNQVRRLLEVQAAIAARSPEEV
jgi:hypothetical protein